jgi:hypothetical protein
MSDAGHIRHAPSFLRTNINEMTSEHPMTLWASRRNIIVWLYGASGHCDVLKPERL